MRLQSSSVCAFVAPPWRELMNQTRAAFRRSGVSTVGFERPVAPAVYAHPHLIVTAAALLVIVTAGILIVPTLLSGGSEAPDAAPPTPTEGDP